MSMKHSTSKNRAKKAGINTYPERTPRFWHGMRFCAAMGLLIRNRFHVHPVRWGMVFTVLFAAVINSTLYYLQRLFCGRKIGATKMEHPPIFIIGHWRSGTTHLHELMVRDRRFACANTYDCFAPNHFVISGWLLPKLFWFLLPEKRPMDNMLIGFDRPQEDDIALCGLNAPTPYFRLAFPNHPPPYNEFLNMERVDKKDLACFRRALKGFVQALTYSKKKRLVLKSPPHTGRIEVLADLFPGAKFIHIVRDPFVLFPSTRRTWESLDYSQAFQRPHHKDLDEYILRSLVLMYEGFERQRAAIPSNHICDVRYEDLARDPVGEVRRIYGQLELGDFENIRDPLEDYLESQQDYRPNQHLLAPEISAAIELRWGDYIDTYGYTSSIAAQREAAESSAPETGGADSSIED